MADTLGDERLRGANSALEAYEIAGKPLADWVVHAVSYRVAKLLPDTAVGVVVIDRAGAVLGRIDPDAKATPPR